MSASALSATGLIIGGIVFVVLFVILSVPLWISIIAGVGALVIWAMVGGAGVASRPHRTNPGRG